MKKERGRGGGRESGIEREKRREDDIDRMAYAVIATSENKWIGLPPDSPKHEPNQKQKPTIEAPNDHKSRT